jgi:hypothetical protein
MCHGYGDCSPDNRGPGRNAEIQSGTDELATIHQQSLDRSAVLPNDQGDAAVSPDLVQTPRLWGRGVLRMGSAGLFNRCQQHSVDVRNVYVKGDSMPPGRRVELDW